MKLRLSLNVILGLAIAGFVTLQAEAKNCKKGKPCGNSCIAQNDVCHKEAGAVPVATRPPVHEVAPQAQAQPLPVATPRQAPVTQTSSTPSLQTLPGQKTCKKGKPCGGTCIPKKAECLEK